MQSKWDTWLGSLGNRLADLDFCVRGLPVKHTVSYPGDMTTATLEAAVKASPDATAELAVFTIGTPSFADGKTTWEFSLTGAETGALPADSDGDGVEFFIYDILLTPSGGDTARIAGGLFPVSGFVTEPA